MTIRSTPTLADCRKCGKAMAAIRGPFSKNIGRPKPPVGYRLGYIRFKDGGDYPVCAACVANALPSNIDSYRRLA